MKKFLAIFSAIVLSNICASQSIAGHVEMRSTGVGVAATISGSLVPEDIIQIEAIARTGQLRLIVLAGPGGSLEAGYGIGLIAAKYNVGTYIPRGYSCASACGMAWLGGTTRIIQSGASVGFHRPYDKFTGIASPTSETDKQYLLTVGIPIKALDFLFSKGKDEIAWLTPQIALLYGIDVKTVP